MTALPKTMKKCGPRRNQTNYKSFQRYWRELSKNVLFIEFESLCQKLWAFMSNFGICYDAHSPNMAMPRDPRSNFRKIYIFLILHLILDKAAKFLVEKRSTSEVISQKPHGGGGVENTHTSHRKRLDRIYQGGLRNEHICHFSHCFASHTQSVYKFSCSLHTLLYFIQSLQNQEHCGGSLIPLQLQGIRCT